VIRDLAERGAPRRPRPGIGRAAVMIGVITVLTRLVGFGRQVVFAHTVGTTCLGTAYTTANMVPNIIYDIVLGGALSSVVVPVLAGPAGGAQSAEPGASPAARQIASALLTWTVLLLVPVSAVLAIAAHPIVSALLSGATGCPHGPLAGVGARMLIVFAPQVLLYGLAVVLYGVLQSHRRFGAPALAPLLSSLVVIGTYAAFGAVGGAYVNRLAELPPTAEYLLSGGTTLGVLALVATAVVPAWRLGLGSRPTLRFPPGVGLRVRRLAMAGVATLVAQDASVAAVIVLANRYGDSGALVIYGFAWAVFVVPYAVLAVPIATSAFPELSAHDSAGGDTPRAFDLTAAASTRTVMVASFLGAAVLIGAREPIARVFESRSAAAASVLALALAAFAPGLVGYGLSANLSRVLYARHRNRAPALAVAGGWLLVIAANAAIVPFVPPARVVPVLGLGTTLGLTVSGAALLILVRRERGPAALHGVPRAVLAGLAGCVTAAAAGWAVAAAISASVPALPAGAFLLNVALSLLVTVVVTGVFAAVVLSLDGGDLRAALSRLRARPSA
jgi:murein biosynthesis integral membrane protein MurJ